jgi:hypothetical protein
VPATPKRAHAVAAQDRRVAPNLQVFASSERFRADPRCSRPESGSIACRAATSSSFERGEAAHLVSRPLGALRSPEFTPQSRDFVCFK